ncbi:MFS transporter [Streptomyces sp. NPDC001668]|uniref:MFS transporter n=1 Tax=unclassified Streptomyces TaxID=2593676 RepID=UPI0036BA67F2
MLLDVTVALPAIGSSLGVFGAGSPACGLVQNVGVLVAARVVQGVGPALLLGTLALIGRAFPDEAARARAIGVWAGIGSLALPAGPLLGGALVDGLGRRSVFLINVPVVAFGRPNTARQTGGAIGIAVAGAVVGGPGDQARFLRGFHAVALGSPCFYVAPAALMRSGPLRVQGSGPDAASMRCSRTSFPFGGEARARTPSPYVGAYPLGRVSHPSIPPPSYPREREHHDGGPLGPGTPIARTGSSGSSSASPLAPASPASPLAPASPVVPVAPGVSSFSLSRSAAQPLSRSAAQPLSRTPGELAGQPVAHLGRHTPPELSGPPGHRHIRPHRHGRTAVLPGERAGHRGPRGVPWPRISRPPAISTMRCAVSSRSSKTAVPL